ncbi:MAG: amino acid adenylation domain-containing protein [Kofleriaceae bacterium]
MTDSILALIDEAVRTRPAAIAVVCGDDRVMYRELGERSRALAAELVARGVRPGQLVGVAIEPSPWAPITMLAVLEAGAAYVPLDPGYPRARLEDMIAQLGDAVLVSTTVAARGLPVVPTITLDTLSLGSAPFRRAHVTPDSLAYVIFTSGSTGRPKGVMVTHRGLGNLVREQIEMFAIGPSSVVLQFAPLSFDASVSEIFTTLAAGATLCLAPRDDLVPGPRLASIARRHRVTIATLPPSSLALLDPADFPSLSTIVSAGEACSAALVARWSPGRRFINAYGPTEITVCATMAVCQPDGLPPGLGRALANVSVRVLDAQLQPVASGEIGELFVGGVGVARGYLGRPDLTGERFVPDPTEPGARMYRTGDLARVRGDGALEFLGRADDQIKLRGHRIEPGEIETVLRAVHGVRDALVLAREPREGDVRLVAYLVADAGLDRAVVRAALDARLPAFARPTDLVVLDAWPRSPAGKIDRPRLPVPARVGSAGAARSELEYRLTRIWEDVLGIAGVGPTDDFFDLGGHSLLAIRMLSRVRAELDVDLPLSIIAERRSIAALVEAISSHGTRTLRSPVALRTRAGNGGAGIHSRPRDWPRALFLAPPVSGSALAYLPLERALAADRPLYAFHAPGFTGTVATPDRFEDLAAHFVRELLVVQPTGPYLLGGWSIGGALAFEMALQLAARGYDVPHLILIDTNAPNPYLAEGIKQKFGELTPATLAFMYVNNFGRCFGLDLGLDRTRFVGLAAGELEHAALVELRRVPACAPDLDPARLAAHLAVFSATARGFASWRPARRYPGRIALILAREGHPEFAAERYDWSDFVEQPVDTLEVPGNHFSLVNEPHVGALGAALDRVLETLP